jgi:hypothetical protein
MILTSNGSTEDIYARVCVIVKLAHPSLTTPILPSVRRLPYNRLGKSFPGFLGSSARSRPISFHTSEVGFSVQNGLFMLLLSCKVAMTSIILSPVNSGLGQNGWNSEI